MRIQTRVAVAAVLAFAALGQTIEAGARSGPLFIPNHNHEGGDHYDTVKGNFVRRCTELDLQFVRESRTWPDSERLRQATALYSQGAAHCRGGAGEQGIDELSDAITLIGGIPHTSF